MMKCPNAQCGHENVDGTQFCEMCGEELAPAASGDDSPTASPAASNGDIQCPACENMNPPENVVCEVCGTELRAAAADTSAAPTSPNVVAAADAASTPPAASLAADPDDLAADESAVNTAAAPTSPNVVASADADVVAVSTPPVSPPGLDTDTSANAVALKPGMVKLVVEQGMSVGKQFVLSDAEMLVGREDEEEDIYPDIDLSDQDEGFVHRRHATLNFENDVLRVTHLGGANKTRLNNKPIPDNAPQAVKLGDKVAFGKVVLRVLPL